MDNLVINIFKIKNSHKEENKQIHNIYFFKAIFKYFKNYYFIYI
jgi:hypothetical protein